MALPGRNDPCPCGSGKKFKHCHLVRAQPTTGITPQDRDAAFDALARYAERDEFLDAVDHAILVWMGRSPHGDVDETFEDIADHETSFQAFWDWLYFDAPLATGGTIASVFLQRRARSLHPRAEDYIRLMSSTHLRLYQVREARPGEGLLLRDLWTNDDLFVVERSGSHQVVMWDTLVARVHVHADGTRQLEGCSLLLPPAAAEPLARMVKAEYRRQQRSVPDLTIGDFFKLVAPVFHQEWYDLVAMAPPLDLRTTDGDALTASALVFDVPRAGDALVTLLGAPDFEPGESGEAIWFDLTSDPPRLLGGVRVDRGTLTLQTLSRERAARGRARMEDLLGPLRLVREEHRAAGSPPDADFDGVDSRADVIAINDVPELAAYLEQQDRAWLDLEIPALDGATPRAAAQSRRLRPRLVELLVDIENRQARMALGGRGRDVAWMWSELGLKRP
jgi:hypothetical protein